MASFGAPTPMLPTAADDNVRVSVWSEHVSKELQRSRATTTDSSGAAARKLEAVEAKAGLQAPVETRRRMRRTLLKQQSETEQLRAKLAGLYVKHHGVDSARSHAAHAGSNLAEHR